MTYIMKMDQAITNIKYKDIHSSIVMQIGMYQALELCTRAPIRTKFNQCHFEALKLLERYS